MNYSKIYDDLINRAIPRGLDKSKVIGYYEKHHILPKCLGGKDESENYVLLTFKEHVLAHRLLNLIYPHTKGLTMALTRMLMQIVDDSSGKKIKKRLTVRDAEEIRKLYSESFKGERNPMYGSKRGNPRFGLKGKNAPHYGHPQPQKVKDAISKANKGRFLGEKSPWYGVKMYGSANHNAKRVQAPDGTIYGSMVECAAAYGVTKGIMQRWVTKCPEKGFKYLPKEPKKK